MNRAWPARTRGTDRTRRLVSERRSLGWAYRQLSQRRRHRALAHFLKRAAAILRHRRVAAQQQNRRFGFTDGKQWPHGVSQSTAGSDQRNADLAGQLGMSFRHENSRRLMPGVNDLDAKLETGVIDRHDLVARQRENPARSGRFERLCKKVRAAHHKIPFMFFLSEPTIRSRS